ERRLLNRLARPGAPYSTRVDLTRGKPSPPSATDCVEDRARPQGTAPSYPLKRKTDAPPSDKPVREFPSDFVGGRSTSGASVQIHLKCWTEDQSSNSRSCPRVAAFPARYLYSHQVRDGIGRGGGRKLVPGV